MTTTLNNFASETQLTTSESTIVSTSTTERKYIGMGTVYNTSTSPVDITVWRLLTATTGTTGSGGNQSWEFTLPAKTSRRLDKVIGQVLGFSMKISVMASTAAVVNIDISGTTETTT